MAKRFKQQFAPDAKGMRGARSRVASSRKLRRKRADTKMQTLEKIYHKNIGADRLQLQTVLARRRKPSLKKLIK